MMRGRAPARLSELPASLPHLAAYRDQWRVLCGAKARGAVHSKAPPRHLGPVQKYTTNVKLDNAHRYVEIDMIFETARFELVFGSSASQDDHFSPLRHPKGINRRRLVEALAEGNDERQHSQGGRHHIQITTTQTASPPMTPPGAADNHI